MLQFIEVNKNNEEHIKELFYLIKNKKFNISHQKNPSFNEHLKFVKCSNYRKWYLVKKFSTIFGSFYITHDNTIGVNVISNEYEEYMELIDLIFKNFKPLPPIKSSRSEFFIINVNPNNLSLIKALKALNMYLIQHTYAYKREIR